MIAKYRLGGFPGGWYLTDFTMEQVEGRIADLEAREARLEEALRECVEIGETLGCTDPGCQRLSCAMLKKAREVLDVA